MRPSLLTYQPMDCMVAVRFRGPRFEKRRGSVVARLGTQGPIQILELRDHLIGVEARDSRFPSSQRHLRAKRRVLQEANDSLGKLIDVARTNQESFDAFVDRIRNPSDRR